MPKISIIVPIYNGDKYLNTCFDSLFKQTLKDIEVIAINDGSSDKSLDIMQKYQAIYGNRMKIIDSNNNGAGGARNRGLDIADAEYIKFVDADDYLKLDILDRMIKMAKENEASVVIGNYTTIWGPIKHETYSNWADFIGDKNMNPITDKDSVVKEMPSIGNKLISRELFGDLRFPEKTKWEDLAIMPVVLAKAKKIYKTNESVYNYRIHMNTTTNDFINKNPNIIDIFKSLNALEENMNILNLDKEYKEQIKGLYILHSLFRIHNVMMWVNFPKNDKKEVINYILNIVELKYPNWKENEYLKMYMNKNHLFNTLLNKQEKYMDSNLRADTSNEVLIEKITNKLK